MFRLNISVQKIASNRDIKLECYTDDGLGNFRGFVLKLDIGVSVFFEQSDHLTNVSLFGRDAHKGPVVYVDASDALSHGYEILYWGIIHELNISESNICSKPTDISEWTSEARVLIDNLTD